ncbi:MAG: hypothetical protein AAFU85_33145, partial [Planctomycetota bacterium]
ESLVNAETVYLGRLATKGLAASFFELDQPDEATAAMQRFRDSHGEDLLPRCEKCLYDLDTPGLLAELSALDETTALDWLSDTHVQSRLARMPDWQSITGAFPAFTPNNVSAQSVGTLVVPTTRVIDPASIKQSLDSALDSDFSVRRLGVEDGTTGWVATTTTGDRVILLVRDVQYQIDSLPPSLATELEAPARTIDLYFVGHRPRALERLFRVMGRFAADETIAAEWYFHVWYGDELEEQLRWRDRVPVSRRTLRQQLLAANPREVIRSGPGTASDSDPVKNWVDRIDAASGRLAVQIESPAWRWRETISAVATGVQAESELLVVTPERDSLIHPLVRAGATISLPLWRVRPSQGEQTLLGGTDDDLGGENPGR